MNSPLVIAVDGPAGSGKSTVAKLLSLRLSIPYIDTGAMYRVVALHALQRGVSLSDGESVASVANEIEFELRKEPDGFVLAANGHTLGSEIRTREISDATSRIARWSPVRKVMVEKQKRLIGRWGGVVEGRDATTVICPDAPLKIYLSARSDVRAKRRHRELSARGESGSLADIAREIEERDLRDSTREDSPLKVAEGAWVIDSSDRTPEEIEAEICACIDRAGLGS